MTARKQDTKFYRVYIEQNGLHHYLEQNTAFLNEVYSTKTAFEEAETVRFYTYFLLREFNAFLQSEPTIGFRYGFNQYQQPCFFGYEPMSWNEFFVLFAYMAHFMLSEAWTNVFSLVFFERWLEEHGVSDKIEDMDNFYGTLVSNVER